MIAAAALIAAVYLGSEAAAGQPAFARQPRAERLGRQARISFELAQPADVAVAILDARGKVVRHLAAGVLGAKRPPEPLKAGLEQSLLWDGNDDFGKPAAGAPFKVRVRAGTGVALGQMIGHNPYAMGHVSSLAADPDGCAYVMSEAHGPGNFKQIIAIGPDGEYQRTVLPFPADLPPEKIADFARWDGAPRPINRNGLGPEFYTTSKLTLVKTTDSRGLLLTDGARLFRLARDGGMAGGGFLACALWGKKKLPNSGRGPVFLTVSPDGEYVYLSGPFSVDTMYGHKADADFPPGQVYRMRIGQPPMRPFAKLPTTGHSGKRPNWVNEHTKQPGHFTVPHGPIHDVAVDREGNVLVADRDGQRLAVFDPSGEPIGQLKVDYPDLVIVHPRDGAVYVLAKEIVGYHQYRKSLLKFDGWRRGRQVARLDLPVEGDWPMMALAAGPEQTILWLGGIGGSKGLLRVEDRGSELRIVEDLAARGEGALQNVDKIAVDYDTDEVYVNDAWRTFRKFNGLDGSGGGAVEFEKGKSATDLTIGPDGQIYAQLGPGYSGPLGRWGRDRQPAPYEPAGSHVLSKYIYGRYGAGYCEKGIGVGTDGTVYIMWMYEWAKYFVTAFGPDGLPRAGPYLKGKVRPDHYEKGTPRTLDGAIIGPVPGANGGVRVDSRGNIYLGIGVHPASARPPAGFEKDKAYDCLVGSIIKFPPQGGQWLQLKAEKGQPPPARPPGPGLMMRAGNYFAGAQAAYFGYAPLSGRHPDAGWLGNSAYCVCRVARFDLDRYDRLYMPNAVTNSVRIVDNAGNLIVEFGSYGNFDSAGPDSAIARPPIPLGWPVGVGVSDEHIYVADMYNRRVVRVDKTYAAEQTCAVQ